MTLARLRPHWRTLLGAVLGAAGGVAYSYFIGCRTGGCAITANPWVAGFFFGFSGAVVLAPGPKREGTPREGAGPA